MQFFTSINKKGNEMGHLSTHVLDTMNGCPAAGMRVTLEALDHDGTARTLKTLTLNSDGRNDGGPLLNAETMAGSDVAPFGFAPSTTTVFDVAVA